MRLVDVVIDQVTQDDFVVHCAMRLRACSMVVAFPSRIERRPASMAVSISGIRLPAHPADGRRGKRIEQQNQAQGDHGREQCRGDAGNNGGGR